MSFKITASILSVTMLLGSVSLASQESGRAKISFVGSQDVSEGKKEEIQPPAACSLIACEACEPGQVCEPCNPCEEKIVTIIEQGECGETPCNPEIRTIVKELTWEEWVQENPKTALASAVASIAGLYMGYSLGFITPAMVTNAGQQLPAVQAALHTAYANSGYSRGVDMGLGLARLTDPEKIARVAAAATAALGWFRIFRARAVRI